ncbi:MAG TPA: hypothetical protein VGH43_20410 [Jatrophihabitans sp.]|jgi:hypothetical protein
MIRHKAKLAAVAGVAVLGVAWVSASSAVAGQSAAHRVDVTKFQMVRSQGAMMAGCLPHAHANVSVQHGGPVEVMNVFVKGLPAHREFDLFVIQVPDAPFGLSWYQGDIDTDRNGAGHGRFVGRFSIETFIVAPGSAPAPKVHPTDGTSNPAIPGPVHTYHLGLWFNSPRAAARAGCAPPNTVTPFNGRHHAGVQVLSTRQAPVKFGPLRRIH